MRGRASPRPRFYAAAGRKLRAPRRPRRPCFGGLWLNFSIARRSRSTTALPRRSSPSSACSRSAAVPASRRLPSSRRLPRFRRLSPRIPRLPSSDSLHQGGALVALPSFFVSPAPVAFCRTPTTVRRTATTVRRTTVRRRPTMVRRSGTTARRRGIQTVVLVRQNGAASPPFLVDRPASASPNSRGSSRGATRSRKNRRMRIWTGRSSLTSSRSARRSNRIAEAKACDHILEGHGFALRILDSLEREVVILKIFEVLEDSLPNVESLRASRLPRKRLEPSLNILRKSQGQGHAIQVSHFAAIVKRTCWWSC
jgi:hypothetical protein